MAIIAVKDPEQKVTSLPKFMRFGTSIGDAISPQLVAQFQSKEGVDKIERLPGGSLLHTTHTGGKLARVGQLRESETDVQYNLFTGNPLTPPAIAKLVARFLPETAKEKKIVVRDVRGKGA